ncbi:PREDICTED: pentatricopeptide repeat-containing protein At4g01990, mitochondrial [Camelina sativa]|uniref:Pentatricopeptide repeat-containing protein At4g01990, mitochondrial n=1 Tax=Camelina sativa TaxID=90675 RepID=A0ABM0T8X7_CAMSA|nr:PREDICTED: pentatricopeptide repeat-containing protein At4g01990, mitochondrial [Camelina sativa]
MNSVSRFARRFCATLAAVPAEISVEASASVPTKAKKHPSIYKKLSSLGTRGGKMEETLNQFVMEGVPVKKHELIRYAKDLRKFRQPQRALEIFEWMERKEIAFSSSDHAIRLDLIAKTKGLEAAENYFNSLDDSSKNQSTYGSLLNCYCVEREEEKAKAHFENMVDLNHVSNSLPFNNLMAMYLRLDQPEKVPEVVVAMKQRNITPCDITYSMWIQSCGSLKDLDGVEKVLEEMKAEGEETSSSWDTFANLAAIYVKVGLYDKAEEALKSLESKMNPHLRDSFHFLISLYAGVSNAKEVYRVWDLLKKRHPNVNNTSYLIILQALSKLNDVDGVKRIFTEWESTCWTYDMRMANVAISSYLKQNMYEDAEAVFNGAMKKCKGQFSKARQLLMMHLLKNDQADLALKHFEAAVLDQDKNWIWSSELIRLFFLHFEEAKDVDGAEEFCKTLTKWSPLDSETYTLLMKTYLSAGEACPDMRKRLEEQGIQVDEEQECLLSKICT